MDIAFGPYGLTAKADASGVDLKVVWSLTSAPTGVDLKVYVKDISCLEFVV